MFRLLEESGAQRSLYAEFSNGERVAIATVTEGGVRPITQSNRTVLLNQEHYFEMYQAHLLGDCWFYETSYDPEDKSSLELGMQAVGAEVLLSCPIKRQYVLTGALSISFDKDVVAPEKIYPVLKEYAQQLGSLEQ